MRSTGVWVTVVDGDGVRSVRMLHVDSRGRECVRYARAWRLVEEKGSAFRRQYVLKGTV